jgi:dihydropteroate synthase
MKRYYRPLGLLSGSAANDAIAAGLASPLTDGLAYTLVEIIERDGADIRRTIKPLCHKAGEGGTRRFGMEVEGAEDLGGADNTHAPSPSHFVRTSLSRFAGEGPVVMGIVNATPDSFSDGGAYLDSGRAIAHAEAMIRAGAAIVDIGGESTRPGAAPVNPDEEIRRVVPVIAGIREAANAAGVIISVDTRNARTMRAALDAGAGMINDVSALTHDPASLAVAAAADVPVVLMHMLGDPTTMQQAPAYGDVALDVYDYLEARIAAAEAAGIARSLIVADPGIGFGKTTAHNLALLNQLSLFHGLGVPLLVGVSRKSLIANLSVGEPPDRRFPGSLALGLAAIRQGTRILRVHDVAETIQALKLAAALDQA